MSTGGRPGRKCVASGLLLLLGIPAALAIGAVAIAPLRRVTAVAKRIAGGDPGARHRFPSGRHDEVGSLAAAFDVMLGQLYQKEAESARSQAGWRNESSRDRGARTGQPRAREAVCRPDPDPEQLIVADRRVSVGRLAAGVAHEIDNPLSFIHGNLAYLADAVTEVRRILRSPQTNGLTATNELAEMANAISESRQGTTRVQHIVRGLKLFSRGNDEEQHLVEIRPALEAAIDMAMHEVKHRAHLSKSVGALPGVVANEVRLSRSS